MRSQTLEAFRAIVARMPALQPLSQGRLGDIVRSMLKPSPNAKAEGPRPQPYAAYRAARIAECRSIYPNEREEGLLSFITTVWNTDVEFLRVLADSLEEQEGGAGFEWLILDNGSVERETIDFLAKLAKRPYVRLKRVEKNLGIIGGMRYVLERARGRYVLPLDSDDYLYPQCVSIFTHYIRKLGYPALLYSDEDKLNGKVFRDAYAKPDWDPVLFIHSCYIAHLCAIDRELAIELGAYSDANMEACHDWDTFLRFYSAGHTPAHIAEILYSWRMHSQSTAGNIDSKPEVINSHISLQTKFLKTRNAEGAYEITRSPLFGRTPDWRLMRKTADGAPKLTTLLMADNKKKIRGEFHTDNYPGHSTYVVSSDHPNPDFMTNLADAAASGGLVHLLWDEVSVDGGDWPLEAVSLMELFDDVVMVGGRIWSADHRILAAGEYFGFGRGCDTPDRGRLKGDPGFFAQMWKAHSVSAVSSQHAIVRAKFFADALEALTANGIRPSLPFLGAWLGAAARRQGKRIVYTPFMGGLAQKDWDARVTAAERARYREQNRDLMPDTEFLSPHLGLDPAASYALVESERRNTHLESLLATP